MMWWSEAAAEITGDPLASVAVDGVNVPTNLADMSAYGLLVTLAALVIVSMFRGWIVVKLHYDTLLKRCEIAEAANARLLEINATQAAAIEKNTAVGDTVVRVMGAIQDARPTAGDPA